MGKAWTQEELETLESLLSDSNGHDFPKRYQNACISRGFPKRTEAAIRSQVSILRKRANPVDDNFSVASLARVLGLNSSTVANWVWDKKIKFTKSGKYCKIKRADFVEFANHHPALLRKADRDALAYFLGEEKADLFKQIESPNDRKRLRYHAPDGTTREFESISEAARQLHLSQGGMKYRIQSRPNEWEILS
jgi:excisionase family DNA binding protein